MHGRVFNIQKFCLHDGRGIRTTVFLKGCPLACGWCHNPESQDRGPERTFRPDRCIRCGACVEACPAGALTLVPERSDGPEGPRVTPGSCVPEVVCQGDCEAACPTGATAILGRRTSSDAILAAVLRDRPYYEESGGGMTVSGGEPLLQPEFLESLLRAARDEGLHTTVDTCGHAAAEVVERVAALTDAVLYDVKLLDDDAHRRHTGVSNRLILDNLHRLVARQRVHGAPEVTVRVPLVAGVNDADGDATALGDFLTGLDPRPPVDLLPYQPLGQSKYERMALDPPLRDAAAPSPDRLAAVVRILRDAGLRVTVRGDTP